MLFSVEGDEDAVEEEEGDDVNLSATMVVSVIVVRDAVAVMVVGDSRAPVEVLKPVVGVLIIVMVEPLPLPSVPGVEGMDDSDGDNKVETGVGETAAG